MEVNTDFNLQQCSPDVTKMKADHQPNDDCIRLIQSLVDLELPIGREHETMVPYGRKLIKKHPNEVILIKKQKLPGRRPWVSCRRCYQTEEY